MGRFQLRLQLRNVTEQLLFWGWGFFGFFGFLHVGLKSFMNTVYELEACIIIYKIWLMKCYHWKGNWTLCIMNINHRLWICSKACCSWWKIFSLLQSALDKAFSCTDSPAKESNGIQKLQKLFWTKIFFGSMVWDLRLSQTNLIFLLFFCPGMFLPHFSFIW